MTFKSGAQGINKQGKTKGTNLGDDGKCVATTNGGKSSAGGKTNESMLAEGRNRAKLAYQTGSSKLKGKGF
jgi:hypothetical protein